MNKYLKIYLPLLMVIGIGFSSCHKLDVAVQSKLTDDNFPQTQDQFILASGPAYTNFRATFATQYWFMQSLSTDESIMPARGGNWFDSGKTQQMHLHTWTADNAILSETWTWISSTVSSCNQILATFNSSTTAPDKQVVAEVRTMRAISYFIMMDLWGNVPINTTFGSKEKAVNTPRAQVFSFIEKELLEAKPDLSATVNASTYGRPTKYTAFALLAKLYLNAAVYTGTSRNADVPAVCDSIISSGKYALESDYLGMFKINNGPTIKEFIFAIPFDGSYAQGQFFARYSIHRAMRAKYSLPYTTAGVVSTIPSFYAKFNLAGDSRNKQWQTGLQYLHNGSPLLVATTKKGFDESYTGADGSAAYSYQVDLTPNIVLKNVASFDVGNDEKAWSQGYRNNKFYPDSTSTTRNQGNDVPVFRYSDVLLMKAEAILRGAAATLGQTPVTLVNSIRTARTAPTVTAVTLDNVYDERCRELTWESWHRNDMIRFGKFEEAYLFKTNTETYRRIFPIPNAVLTLNSSMTQNPGY